MATQTHERATPLPVPAREAFEWHLRPGALRRLLPPFDSARVVEGSGPTERLEKGARTTLRVGLGPLGLRWVAEIADLQPERAFFVDRQVSGPFRSWVHRHQVGGRGSDTSTLTDTIEYALPLGALGRLVGGRAVRRKLARMFAWRHRVTAHDLAAHRRAAAAGFRGKRVAITGASGLIGSTLAAFLRTGGHEVLELVRREPEGDHEVRWDPAAGTVDTARLEGIDGLVHLAGASIFGLRWTEAKKRAVAGSRIQGTRAIVDALNRMERPPAALVCASAIGFYGSRGDEVLTEDEAHGEGFLADTCVAWEAEVARLRDDVREVRGRLGVVLDAGGGALATMLPAFRAGIAGRLGSGDQWFPWIALDDAVGAFHAALWDERLRGPVNLVAPGEVTNRGFTKALGGVLGRPTVLPAPAFALRLGLGREQADEMLLASTRVRPAALEAAGFPFAHPRVEGALGHTLGRRLDGPGGDVA